MSLVRCRNPYLVGATKWAIMRGDPDAATFAGVSEETDSVFAIDRLGPTVLREPLEKASAVSPGSDGLFWVITREGRIARYAAAGCSLQYAATIDADGQAIAVTDADVIYLTQSGGRFARTDGATIAYGITLPHPALGLVLGDGCVYALLDNADLVVLVEDTVAQTFRAVFTLDLPAVYGLRDMVLAFDSLFCVGTDRLGNGSVVEIDLTDPLEPALVDVDRVESPFIVLTTDGFSRVGTVLPQSPYTMPEVPWQGRTDSIRQSAVV